MGDFVLELQQQLKSMPTKLTPDEISVQRRFVVESTKQFTLGTVVASGLTWIATRRLSKAFQMPLVIGAGAIAGTWRLVSSLKSCVEQGLALEGTRLQKELAIMLIEPPQFPRATHLLSKHFYSEKIYDDSTSNQPKVRWRYRATWFDNNANSQSTQDMKYQSDSDSDSQGSNNNQSNTEAKQFLMNRAHSATFMMADPFDCIFGLSTTNEESSDSDTYTVPPTVVNVNHKRSRRRRRLQRKHESQSIKT